MKTENSAQSFITYMAFAKATVTEKAQIVEDLQVCPENGG